MRLTRDQKLAVANALRHDECRNLSTQGAAVLYVSRACGFKVTRTQMRTIAAEARLEVPGKKYSSLTPQQRAKLLFWARENALSFDTSTEAARRASDYLGFSVSDSQMRKAESALEMSRSRVRRSTSKSKTDFALIDMVERIRQAVAVPLTKEWDDLLRECRR